MILKDPSANIPFFGSGVGYVMIMDAVDNVIQISGTLNNFFSPEYSSFAVSAVFLKASCAIVAAGLSPKEVTYHLVGSLSTKNDVSVNL